MNTDKVILYPIKISKQAQITSFQIKIPSDAKRISGIEISVRGWESIGQFIWDPPMYDLFRARISWIMGYLNLRSTEKHDVFFNTDVRLHDNSLFQGDFSQSAGVPGLRAFQWIRGIKREEIPLVFTGEIPEVIFGTYQDRHNKLYQQDRNYTVNLYLWYSTIE